MCLVVSLVCKVVDINSNIFTPIPDLVGMYLRVCYKPSPCHSVIASDIFAAQL